MNYLTNPTINRMNYFYKTLSLLCFSLCWLQLSPTFAQQKDEKLEQATLENVVAYAIKHQPLIQQSQIDEEATNSAIRGKLADWYPQVNLVYNYQRNVQLQTVITSFGAFRSGTNNISSPQIYATQNLFNRDVLLASRTASDVRTNAVQTTLSRKIDLTVSVTKAFYDVLATMQQIKVGQGDVIRLKQSLKTAHDQYEGGIVDKTDYKRATIALSNTQAVLKSNQEILKSKLENLKTYMGYPTDGELNIVYDTLQMENEIAIDTTQQVDYSQRIEYKLYQTLHNLQEANVKYNQWSYLPTITAYGYYINYYYNNNLSELYNKTYPNSYFGATLTLPLFQGGKRAANIKQQKWLLQRLDWDIANLKNVVNSQYTQTLATYKSYLIAYQTLKQNVELAKEVYEVIQLQYKSGVKSYLEVITAETDLRNARINYFNALYSVLASKIDVQKALGQINY
jgi:outer membrane protein TolC